MNLDTCIISSCNSTYRLRYWNLIKVRTLHNLLVATAPTACGIETDLYDVMSMATGKGCNSTYRLRYWNCRDLAGLYTKPQVATAPTACGIETCPPPPSPLPPSLPLQQHLPLAVLKLCKVLYSHFIQVWVATAPTACGIETSRYLLYECCSCYRVATAPTACGIETSASIVSSNWFHSVATAPTACGIETCHC